MAARIVYKFTTVAPGATVSVFIHGYGDRQAVSYSAVIYNQFTPTVFFPQAHVTLTQGETFRWAVDGTIGRKVYITNHSLSEPAGVDILEIIESF